MRPPVKLLLVSRLRWPSAAQLAGAFIDAGAEVEVVCPVLHPMRRLRGVRRQYSYSILRSVAALERAILLSRPDFIIPCDELAKEHLVRVRSSKTFLRQAPETLLKLLDLLIGSAEVRAIVNSRPRLIELAREEGVLAPATQAIEAESALAEWVSREGAHAYLKRDGSFGGDGTREISNLDEAKSLFAALAKGPNWVEILKELLTEQVLSKLIHRLGAPRPVVSVQRAIIGSPANCSVVAYAGEVLAIVAVNVLRTARPNSLATVVKVVESYDMEYAARKIAGRLELTGIFGLDFIVEHSTGRYWLIELNARPTPITHLRLGAMRDPIGSVLCAIGAADGAPHRGAIVDAPIALFPHQLQSESLMNEPGLVHDFPIDQPDLILACTPIRTRIASSVRGRVAKRRKAH